MLGADIQDPTPLALRVGMAYENRDENMGKAVQLWADDQDRAHIFQGPACMLRFLNEISLRVF